MGLKRKPEERDEQEEDSENEDPGFTKNTSGFNDTGDCGKIVSIECDNFMCHSHLKVELGRNVNFITGQNGSGKSAVIAALQICLGMSAKKTQRADKLSHFIQEGSNKDAIVKVTVWNKGINPYEEDLFGERIVVERRIKRSGATSFHMYGPKSPPEFRKMNRKTHDIVAMTDHFALFVENPSCILDQETSKSFMTGSDRDKYEIFMKATLLANIREICDTEMQRRRDTQKMLQNLGGSKKEMLKEDYQKIADRVAQLQGIRDLENELEKAHQAEVWLRVAVKQRECFKLTRELEETLGRQSQLRAEVEKLENTLKKFEQEIEQLNSEADPMAHDLQEARARSNEKREERKKALHALNKDKSEMNLKKKELGDIEKKLHQKTSELAQLHRRSSDDAMQKSKKKIESDLEAIQNTISQKQAKLDEIQKRRDALGTQEDNLENQIRQLTSEKNGLTGSISRLRKDMDQLQRNSSASNGKGSNDVADMINRNRRSFTHPPIWIGQHIELTDMEFWKPAEASLDAAMKSFAVDNQKDFVTLKNLCKDNRITPPKCHVAQFAQARYDISGRVNALHSAGLKSLADIVSIDNDIVFNAVVDSTAMEVVGLMRGESQAKRIGFNPQYRGTITRVFDEHGNSYSLKRNSEYKQSVPEWLRNKSQSTHFSKDTSQEQNRLKDSINSEQRQLDSVERELRQVQADFNSEKSVRQSISHDENKLLRELRDLESTYASTQSKLNSSVAADDFDSKESNLTLRIDELRLKESQLHSEIERSKDSIQQKTQVLQALDQEYDDLQRDEKQYDSYVAEAKLKIETLVRKSRDHLTKFERHKLELANRAKDSERQEAKVEESRASAEEAKKDALEFCSGKEIDVSKDSLKDIDERVQALTQTLKKVSEEQLQDGENLESLIQETNLKMTRARLEYEQYGETLKILKNMLDALKHSWRTRIQKWRDMMDSSKRKMNLYFQHYMSHRNYAGSITFDDEKRTVTVEWSHSEDAPSRKAMQADAGQLSGGEKSFTTLCLLQSLGCIVNCPLRVMDEFDVFMDERNRIMSLKILKDTALSKAHESSSESKQFIFITPHDISSVHDSKNRVKKFYFEGNSEYRN